MNNIFDLDFSRWEIILLSLVPALINVAIFIYVTFFLQKNRINFAFANFVLFVALWQMCEGFMMLSNTAETAFEWARIWGIFMIFVLPFGILFVLYFSGCYKRVSNNLMLLTQFLPAIVCLFFMTAKLNKFNIIKSNNWYWIAEPEPTPITSIIYIWICFGALSMLSILWWFYIKGKSTGIKRKQSLLLAIGFSIPLLCGIILEAILPMIKGMDDIPLTTPLVTVFSITALIAIIKYKLLDYSPKHKWEQIEESMNDGLLIVNNQDEIMYANRMFCKLLGYEFAEIKGKVAFELFITDKHKKQELNTIIQERKKNKSSNYEVQIKAKSGENIWMLVSGSPYIDKNGKIIGSIGLHTDVTERKKSEEKIIKKNRLYSVLSHINQLIVHSDNDQTLFTEACRIATEQGKFLFALIGAINEDDRKINLVAHSNSLPCDFEQFANFRYDDNGPTSTIIKGENFVVINDIEKGQFQSESKQYAIKRGFQSAIFLPIKKSGETICTFNLFSAEVDFFDKEEIALLVEISGDISFALDVLEKEKQRKKAEAEIIKLNEELEDKIFQRTIDLAKANVQLEKEAEMLICASKTIEQKNKDNTDSLNYAKIIQNATVNKKGVLIKHFPDSFILNMPLNIVSGDFVRVDEKDENVLVALADCTGHGIPGALMSMIGYSFFNDVINYKHKITPSLILRSLDEDFKHLTNEAQMNDGMDVGFCSIDIHNLELNFAGAHRPLYIIRGNQLTEIKGDNLSIGGGSYEKKKFKNHHLKLQKNDCIYMSSDGYADQFGGEKGKKFSSQRLKNALLSIQHFNMGEQEEYLKTNILQWKGELEQVDDICVVGIRI